MNFLKKGPELKLSELKLSKVKVPGFLQDVYYDLKDRHLLPVAAVLLVAIFAVPIALSQSSESEAPAAGEPGATASQSPSDSRSAQLVAKSTPGLRDYRRRLKRLQAQDPFVQQYTESETSGASGGEAGPEGEGPSSSLPSSPEPSSESPAPIPSDPPQETENDESSTGQLTYFSYAIDVRVSAGGSEDDEAPDSGDEPELRRNLPELTMLPSRKTPALIYMGSTKDGKKALMLVSSDVVALFGDAKCVLGSESCQLLELEPGLPETVVYGGAEKTYKIELRKIHLVKTKDLNRAPLGKPKKSSLHPQPHPH
jgi:hypothetical protein